MYFVEVRDHVMIAHSIPGEVFGPAQKLHGATYVIDVCFMREKLDEYDIVVDIGLATDTVKQILSSLNFSNLDEHPDFKGRRSTTEAVARWVFLRVQDAINAGRLGPSAAGLKRLRIMLHESHAARAGFEADLSSQAVHA
ncbi:MAG: 6-carboxytetrahydropterin synthase [Rhodospirillaceae bacterium]|nr:6-carboxytetrahydropterin synthase [Rhodospirillaceae bacterium]